MLKIKTDSNKKITKRFNLSFISKKELKQVDKFLKDITLKNNKK